MRESQGTGWFYISFLLVLPALLLVFPASVLIALYGDVRRIPEFSQTKWSGLVYYFYRSRMRQ